MDDQLYNETRLKLLERGIFWIHGEIIGSMMQEVLESLAILDSNGSPDVEIRITSGGGSYTIGLDVYDAIRRYKGKKTGVVYGHARSMAAIILQACEKRLALPNSRILIHNINAREVSLDTLEDEVRLQKMVRAMKTDQDAMHKILMHRTGKSKEEIEKTCAKNTEMNAKQALEYGLIDSICTHAG